MSILKNNAEKPAGSLPPGLLNKVMVMVATVLVLILILSSLCNGADDEATPPAQQSPGGEVSTDPVDTDLQAAIALQQRRAEALRLAQQRDAERLRLEEHRRLAEFPLRNPISAQNPSIEQSILQPDSAGNLPDPEAIELRRQLNLAELERKITSIRAGPVAQSFRGGNNSATGEERERSIPPDPAQALLRSLAPSVLGGTAAPPAGELDIPLPNSANLPEYENPPRLIDPDDPVGWERVYEGSFLDAVLVNQLVGEFPSPVIAIVNVPFYSADRQRVLIPRGSRLIGTAQAVARRDQGALAVGFHRLVLLDGRHVPLRFLGLNQAGTSGLRDQVDRHYMSTFLAAGAVGLISGLALYQGSAYGGGRGALLGQAGTGTANTGQRLLEPFLNRLPTVTIRAGHRLRVWFTSDLLIPRPQP